MFCLWHQPRTSRGEPREAWQKTSTWCLDPVWNNPVPVHLFQALVTSDSFGAPESVQGAGVALSSLPKGAKFYLTHRGNANNSVLFRQKAALDP